MIRIILGLILTVELMSTAFALKIHNDRILEHREWTTGTAIIGVKTNTDKVQIKSVKSLFKEASDDNVTEGKDGIELHNKLFTDGAIATTGTETALMGL